VVDAIPCCLTAGSFSAVDRWDIKLGYDWDRMESMLFSMIEGQLNEI
jgi:hypothetical protein